MNFINNNISRDTPHTNVKIGTRSRQKGIQLHTANFEKRTAMLFVHPLDMAVTGNNNRIFCLCVRDIYRLRRGDMLSNMLTV